MILIYGLAVLFAFMTAIYKEKYEKQRNALPENIRKIYLGGK